MITVDADGDIIHRGMQVILMTKDTVKHLYPEETSMEVNEYVEYVVKKVYDSVKDKPGVEVDEESVRKNSKSHWKFVNQLHLLVKV
jgi:hypothetical protein